MTSKAAVTIIGVSLFGSAANAHPELQSADPAAGAAVTTSPKQIRITFNENVIPQLSGVEVKDQNGKMIPTGKAATDPANKKLLIVPVNEQLPAGVAFFPLYAYAATEPKELSRRRQAVLLAAAVAALLSGLLWFVFSVANMSGTLGGVADREALW